MSTPNYGFPEVYATEAGRAVRYNEALNHIEAKMGFLLSKTTAAEPASPSEGDAYIIPAAATGTIWSTFGPGSIAVYTGALWLEFPPTKGWHLMVIDTAEFVWCRVDSPGSIDWEVLVTGTP